MQRSENVSLRSACATREQNMLCNADMFMIMGTLRALDACSKGGADGALTHITQSFIHMLCILRELCVLQACS